jgi:glyoxylase-like metal-dependent hydrolase (beta-lactamase superfamily II)
MLPEETGWRIIETPGHAPDHISLYHQESRILIGGDHLIKNISSNAFIEPGYGTIDRPRSLVVYRNALLKLLTLPLDLVYAGHGEEIYDAHDLIKERIRKQDERAEGLLPLIKQGLNAFEMSKALFPHLYLKELPLTMSEVVGHLDLLVEQRKIKMERNGDRFVIHLAEGGIQPSMEKI